jgi:hypothetical protein
MPYSVEWPWLRAPSLHQRKGEITMSNDIKLASIGPEVVVCDTDKYQEKPAKRGLHQPFQIVDWGKLRMDSASAITTRFRAVQTGVLPNSSVNGLAADETVVRLLAHDWMPRPKAAIGVSKRRTSGGSALTVVGTRNALATLTTTVMVTDPTPASWGSMAALAPNFFSPDFQPHRLDFGELKAVERRSVRVTLICPNDTTLGVAWADQSKSEGELTPRFMVDNITTYSSGWKSLGTILGHVRDIDKTTNTNRIDVREGQEVSIDVSFQSGQDENDRFLNTLRIGDALWQISIPSQADVTLLGDTGAVFVDVHGGLQALKGHATSLDVTLIRIGPPTDVTISADYIPQGVTMSDVTFRMNQNEQRNITLSFNVAQDAPAIRNFQASLGVTSQAGLREVGIGISIYDPILFSKVDVHDGSLTGTMEVTLTSDGAWTWHVELFEHGAFVGEEFMVEFGLYRIEHGSLAAKAIPGESHKTIDQSSMHPDIRDHFFELVDAGVYFESGAADNVFPLAGSLAALFFAVPSAIGAISAFADLFSAPAAAAG